MATNQKFLSLNWQDFVDDLFDNEYPVSEYDVAGDRNSAIIREKDKEIFLDEMAQHFRQVIETLLEEVDDEVESEDETEDKEDIS